MSALRALWERLQGTHVLRAWRRYGRANGDLLAGGVGYFAFFSIFPALALGFTVFGAVLGGRPDLLEAIGNAVDDSLPGMVRTARHPDGLLGLSAPATSTLTITGIVSVVTLLYAGSGWIGALRTGIRAVFGLESGLGNPVVTKLRDLGVLASLGLGVALSAVLTSSVGGLAGWLAGLVGLPGGGLLVSAVGLLVGFLVDTLLMVVLLRVLSGVPLPWVDVRNGAVLGAAALTLLKFFGGQLIARATSNPLLGAVAVAVGLLFWLNLMARVVLFCAAWAANDVDRVAGVGEAGAPAPATVPAPAHSGADPAGAAPPGAAPHTGEVRRADRLALATGALLGAALAAAVGGIRRTRNPARHG
ncbi:MAG TPA: YihY/virulence factor BrkB family protein [Intrasporangium sp.]|uniref:YihY/virulence factor BrkB family protein n=1 Tax=Intrasporangium sp. TaxID=1925024 RepID=UPI002D79BCB4|nr:YihY/virulence factor BrkB family protein [Intrasporangium sp.]HET7399825.1 YihY/virulence factor BrkB family protein [Intrasporangium sp.]